MRHEFVVRAPDEGRRLDRFVQSALGGAPNSLVRRLLRQKKIRVNGARGRAEGPLHVGDVVVVHHVVRELVAVRGAEVLARAYRGPRIDILRETGDFMFVAKPAGVSCSDDGRDPSTLASWLAEQLRERLEAGEVRPEPCHRLDRGTTGIVAIALTAAAFDRFRVALRATNVTKEYEVAVWGAPEQDHWTCDVTLARRQRTRTNEPRVTPADAEDVRAGRAWEARSDFEVIARGEGVTLLRARPLTGRTHQIRAHCLASGLPVVGDPRYGDPARDEASAISIGHQLLHARRLELRDRAPALEVEAPWPDSEAAVLRALGLVAF